MYNIAIIAQFTCAPREVKNRHFRFLFLFLKTEKTFKNEQRSKDAAAKKRPNSSGVGKINNYYEDIYTVESPTDQKSHYARTFLFAAEFRLNAPTVNLIVTNYIFTQLFQKSKTYYARTFFCFI